jgi:hypothetical protein
MAKLLLSNEGLKALGNTVFKIGGWRGRGVTGCVISYHSQGVWFQDTRRLRLGEMVLVKWDLIDAILSEAPSPEPVRARSVGFQA